MADQKDSESSSEKDSGKYFFKKVLILAVTVTAITLLVLFVGYAVNFLLLVFIALLLGVLLRSIRDYVSRFMRLPPSISLAIIVFILFSAIGVSGYLLVPKAYQQAGILYDRAPQEWDKLKRQLWRFDWGREIARENPQPKDFLENEEDGTGEDNDMTKGIVNLFSFTAGTIASVVLVIVIAVYIAAEPEIYERGFLRLFPVTKRPLAADILTEISLGMQWWLLGQIISMLILGTITTLGLYLLGIPYYLILGLFTAVMTFIPNLGPIIAGIPTLLVAYTVSPVMMLYVAVFYILIQSIEGYFITPMIHRKAIDVPPVLIITFQFLLYYLIGFLGVFVAMPLIACLMIIVKRVYIEGILGDSMERKIDIKYQGKTIF